MLLGWIKVPDSYHSKKNKFTVWESVGGKRCVQGVGGETWGKETTGETQT